MACPVCRYPYFFDDICVYCACAAAAAAQSALLGQPRAPPPPLTFQGFEDRRCPCCPFFAGRPAEYPWRHVCRCDVCRFFLARACPDCASPQAGAVAASMDALGRLPPPPQPHHQQHPLGGLGTTRNLAHPSAPAAAWRPEGPPPQSSGVAASAGGHRRRIQCSPPASPLDYIAKPEHDDGWCPACLYNRAPTVFEPRTHVCVCEACIKADAAVCPVCANFGKGDSFDF
ncbi:unnamed protein product [Urochloa decumbens]|uniref:RING-type domain-containing protein n=1 Tax=Urochloa decumbens TaxID=240449 RepID=A0ABC8XW61_9POAL